jgi:hypothetical protein
MTLLKTTSANAFLDQYKRLLCAIAAKPLKIINDYSEARKALYKDGFNKSFAFDSSYEESFVNAVKNATYDMFVYAKKYRSGYALKASDGTWFCVKALTTPLEEMIPEWCVIDTAVLPYCGLIICDGLIVDRHVSIGPNMIASMTQDLKTERKKWQQMKYK